MLDLAGVGYEGESEVPSCVMCTVLIQSPFFFSWCNFGESDTFHCLSRMAIKPRERSLSFSKSKVSRQKVKIPKATRTLTLWI